MTIEPKTQPVSVTSLVKKTLTAANAVERANTKLFDRVRECVVTINGNKKMLSEYKKGLNDCSARSTIHIMIKVAESEVITDLAEYLPESYMSLYEVFKLFNNELNKDTTRLNDLIEANELNRYSTKADITALRNQTRASSANDDAPVVEKTEKDAPSAEDISTNVVALESVERVKVVSKTIETLNFDELAMLQSQIEELMSALTEERDAA